MTDITKINYSHKKIVNKRHTSNNKQWFEEDDGLLIYPHAKEVWIDYIPSTPDTALNNIEYLDNIIMTEDTTVQDRKAWKLIIDSELINGLIPPSYGIDYSINIFANGVKIPTSHPSQPLFDYTNGILSFENSPPVGDITVSVYRYIGRTVAQYIDSENRSIVKAVLGIDQPSTEYIIQHNMATFDLDIILYTYDDVQGTKYWKRDVVPLILLDENRIKIQLSESQAIRYIIKSYETLSI